MSQPDRQASSAAHTVSRYLHADTLGAAIIGYLVYRVKAMTCFFSWPRLGHAWTLPEGTSMHQLCSRCGKEWWANW